MLIAIWHWYLYGESIKNSSILVIILALLSAYCSLTAFHERLSESKRLEGLHEEYSPALFELRGMLSDSERDSLARQYDLLVKQEAGKIYYAGTVENMIHFAIEFFEKGSVQKQLEMKMSGYRSVLAVSL